MRYLAVATDYDGTLASHGKVGESALSALERLRGSGRRLVLVSGRELEDLLSVFPQVELFDRVVAENGGVLYTPSTRQERALGEPPPVALVEELRRRDLEPLSVGRVIVSTWEPHETTVLEAIHALGLEHQVIFNKGAVMILPPGVNKASGLRAALDDLGLSPHNAVGVGDAENDHAFLALCEASVAVANALPLVQERADLVTEGRDGEGVTELADALLADDLANLEAKLTRHHVLLGTGDDGAEATVAPYGVNLLVAGPSSSGKSTLVGGLLERLTDAAYQFCLIDPEGDYEGLELGAALGDSQRAPTVDEVVNLLADAATNVVVNLLGLALEDRPGFCEALLPRLGELRARTGGPHWIVIDEAHHLLPQGRDGGALAFGGESGGLLFVTVHPASMARAALSCVAVTIAVGSSPLDTLAGLAEALGRPQPDMEPMELATGAAVAWRNGETPFRFTIAPTRGESRRHRRKYAEGNLGPDRTFVFRGPEHKLSLRARNLFQFIDLAQGVDNETWLHHLRQRDYSNWFATCVKDDALAQDAARIEQREDLTADESRSLLRRAIEERYTGAA